MAQRRCNDGNNERRLQDTATTRIIGVLRLHTVLDARILLRTKAQHQGLSRIAEGRVQVTWNLSELKVSSTCQAPNSSVAA